MVKKIAPILFYLSLAIIILWDLLLPGYISQPVATLGPTVFFPNWWDYLNIVNIFLLLSAKLMPVWAAQKIFLLLIITCTGLSMYWSFPSKKTWPKLLAGFFYVVNPFFFTRLLIGHNHLLIGYLLLPLFIAQLSKTSEQKSIISLRLALTYFLIVNVSIHTAYIASIAAIIYILLLLIGTKERSRSGTLVAWHIVCSMGIGLILNAHILLSGQEIATTIQTFDWQRDYLGYATADDPKYGLLLNILGMYGYYAENTYFGYDTVWAKNVIGLMPAFVVFFLIFTAGGIFHLVRKRETRKITTMLIILAPISVILAMGLASPITAPIYKFLVEYMPFFSGFREPQKWVMIYTIVIVIGSVKGLEGLLEYMGKNAQRGFISLTYLLISVYTCTLFFGMSNQLKTYWYPEEWHEIKTLLKNHPEGEIVSLPWQIYVPYNFTNGKLLGSAPNQFFYPAKVWMTESSGIEQPFTKSSKFEMNSIQKLLKEGWGEVETKKMLNETQIKYILFDDYILPNDPIDYSILKVQNGLKLTYQKGNTYLYEIIP